MGELILIIVGVISNGVFAFILLEVAVMLSSLLPEHKLVVSQYHSLIGKTGVWLGNLFMIPLIMIRKGLLMLLENPLVLVLVNIALTFAGHSTSTVGIFSNMLSHLVVPTLFVPVYNFLHHGLYPWQMFNGWKFFRGSMNEIKPQHRDRYGKRKAKIDADNIMKRSSI